MLENVPDEWIVGLAQEWLSPKESRRLAGSCRRFYKLLPQPLRIQICSGAHDGCCLGGELFVNHGEVTLPASATLEANVPYYFWKFDYEEQCPVYLGRQLRQTQPKRSENSMNGSIEFRYLLGFRPRSPNQVWTIQPLSDDPFKDPDIVIQPGTPCNLLVAGYDTRPGQVDSTDVHKLVAQGRPTHSGRSVWSWYTVSPDAKTPEDEPSFSYTTSHLTRRRPDSELFLSFSSNHQPSHPKTRRRKRSGGINHTYPLETYAIPDLSDRGAYLLYSPRRWKPHLAPCTGRSESGRSALLEFTFWSTCGILYFKAVVLPFALAIPVVQLDREYFSSPFTDEARPIVNLFESFSARWGCIKYYMATAADVSEGCPLNLETFLRGVTDHEDHKVEHQDDVVSIMMKHESSVDATLVPDIKRDETQLWRFFFSW